MSVIPMQELLPAIVKILKPRRKFGNNIDLTTLEEARTESVHYRISSWKPCRISRTDKTWQVTLSVQDVTEHGCLAKWEIKEPTTPNDQCMYKVAVELSGQRTAEKYLGMKTREYELKYLKPGCCYHVCIRLIHWFQVGDLTWACVLANDKITLNTKKAPSHQEAKPYLNKQKMYRAETRDCKTQGLPHVDDAALDFLQSLDHTQHDTKRNNDHSKAKQRREWRGQTQKLEKRVNAK